MCSATLERWTEINTTRKLKKQLFSFTNLLWQQPNPFPTSHLMILSFRSFIQKVFHFFFFFFQENDFDWCCFCWFFSGINLRLIGKMIPHANDKASKVHLIEEMISRIIKHHIRDRYQQEMESNLLVFQESFRKISCDVLNRLLDPKNQIWIFVKDQAKQRYEFNLNEDDLNITSVYSIIKVCFSFSLSFLIWNWFPFLSFFSESVWNPRNHSIFIVDGWSVKEECEIHFSLWCGNQSSQQENEYCCWRWCRLQDLSIERKIRTSGKETNTIWETKKMMIDFFLSFPATNWVEESPPTHQEPEFGWEIVFQLLLGWSWIAQDLAIWFQSW